MYEVTSDNFEELYPKICDSLKRSKFISFDSEFSGINSTEAVKGSLFDTVEERYSKLSNGIQRCIAIQFGISTFDYNREANKYISEVFNFYLFPKVAPGRDAVFEWQSTAVEFLCSHGFDFNKFAHQGISYLNKDEEENLRRMVADDTIMYNVQQTVSYLEEDELKASYNKVSDWMKNPDAGESMILEASSPMIEYLIQKELRIRFLNIWTESKNKKIILLRVDKELRKILEEKEGDMLEDRLINSYLGFSKIFKLIVDMKKPIVGHNVLLDLLFMHKQFHKQLPNKYKTFKNTIHQLFPTIYDTKNLSFELKKSIAKEETWGYNSLSGLYEFFKVGKGKHLIINAPKIALEENDNAGKFHEAGWDSYCAGYCFIRIANFLAVSRYGSSTDLRPLTNTEILSGPKDHANCVNLIRASINYLNLAGPDPPCQRPQWLHVKSLGKSRIDILQIAKLFSTFGMVDVKLSTRNQALVAVANHGSARDILTRFRANRDIHVAPYSLLRHSPAVRILLWGSLMISGGALAWVVHKNLYKASIT